MASTVGSRLAFEKAKEAIQSAGFSLGQAVLSQSYLRLEIQLSATITNYQIPVLVNDNFTGSPAFNTENRLNLQDAFYVSSLGIFTAAPSSATDTTFQVVTYGDQTVYSASEIASLNTFYNGEINLTVNNRQIVPAYDVRRHYYAPITQSAVDAQYTTSGINTTGSINGSDSGFAPIEPGWVLVGSKQNALFLSLPAAMTNITTYQRAVIICHGHLAQNVTPVR